MKIYYRHYKSKFLLYTVINCPLIVNETSRKNESILFVEDEADLLELFSLGLRKLNRPIVTAHNGDEAILKAKRVISSTAC